MPGTSAGTATRTSSVAGLFFGIFTWNPLGRVAGGASRSWSWRQALWAGTAIAASIPMRCPDLDRNVAKCGLQQRLGELAAASDRRACPLEQPYLLANCPASAPK